MLLVTVILLILQQKIDDLKFLQLDRAMFILCPRFPKVLKMNRVLSRKFKLFMYTRDIYLIVVFLGI